MGKFVEILAMALGGISLFAVCFLGFAITSGKTLDEVPVIGPMLQSSAGEEDEGESLSPAEQIPTSTRPKVDLVEASSGVLQTFSVQSPYSQSELKELVDSVKDTKQEFESRMKDLEAESQDLLLRSEALDDREQKIKDLQSQYDERMKELLLRESEVKRDEAIASETEQLVYVNKAASLADLEPKVAVERLSTYRVEEVAKVLYAMDDDKSAKIVKELPQDRWEDVVDRLSRLRAEFPKKP